MNTIGEGESVISLDSLIVKLNANLVRSQKSGSLNYTKRKALKSELHWLRMLKELLDKEGVQS